MARFKTGDPVRLNYRKSKADYYGKNGRTATAYEYQGAGLWEVELPNGTTRNWYTSDMDNLKGYVSADAVDEAIAQIASAVEDLEDLV